MKTKLQNLEFKNSKRFFRLSIMSMAFVFFASMTFAQTSTVVDIIVGSADHTTLEAAVIAAELDDDLSGAGPFTVFAPTDAAFDALPEGTVASLLADPTGDLADILLYHVVGSKALSTDLSDGQMITTLNGAQVTVQIMDGNVYIDDAMVTVANLEADNGVVHVIDAVILPQATGIKEFTSNISSANIYPNPARDFINVSYELLEGSNLTLELYDLAGQKLKVQDYGYVDGNSTVEFPLNDMKSGMYIIMINSGNSNDAEKFRVVK